MPKVGGLRTGTGLHFLLLQGMKNGAAAAEVAFTAARLAGGNHPVLHEAFVTALVGGVRKPLVYLFVCSFAHLPFFPVRRLLQLTLYLLCSS